MKNTILSIIAISIVSIQTLTAGGPWTKPKGLAYVKLSEWFTLFDQHYTDQGLLDPNVTTGIFNTNLYAEYGLTDRLTGILNGALFSRNFMNNLRSQTTNDIIVAGEALNSIGDINVGFKYSLTKSEAKFPIAASIILGLPTGTPVGGTLNNLQTGDGEFNQIIQLDAGTGFAIKNTSIYGSAYLGFNNRTNNFSDEIRAGAEIGLGLINQKLWLAAKLDMVESLKNGVASGEVTSTSIFANNAEFVSIGLDVNLYLGDRFGVSVGAAGAVRGEIIAAAPSYNIGIFYDIK